jgi:hypothetical protein
MPGRGVASTYQRWLSISPSRPARATQSTGSGVPLTSASIAAEAADWLEQPRRLEGMRADLRALRGRPGAVAALATLVRQLLPPVDPV